MHMPRLASSVILVWTCSAAAAGAPTHATSMIFGQPTQRLGYATRELGACATRRRRCVCPPVCALRSGRDSILSFFRDAAEAGGSVAELPVMFDEEASQSFGQSFDFAGRLILPDAPADGFQIGGGQGRQGHQGKKQKNRRVHETDHLKCPSGARR